MAKRSQTRKPKLKKKDSSNAGGTDTIEQALKDDVQEAVEEAKEQAGSTLPSSIEIKVSHPRGEADDEWQELPDGEEAESGVAVSILDLGLGIYDLATGKHIYVQRFDSVPLFLIQHGLLELRRWLADKRSARESKESDTICFVSLGIETTAAQQSWLSNRFPKGQINGKDPIRNELTALTTSIYDGCSNHWSESYIDFNAEFTIPIADELSRCKLTCSTAISPLSDLAGALFAFKSLISVEDEWYYECLDAFLRYYNIAPGRNEPSAEELAKQIDLLSDADADALFRTLESDSKHRHRFIAEADQKVIDNLVRLEPRKFLERMANDGGLSRKLRRATLEAYLAKLAGTRLAVNAKEKRAIAGGFQDLADEFNCIFKGTKSSQPGRLRFVVNDGIDYFRLVSGSSSKVVGSYEEFPSLKLVAKPVDKRRKMPKKS